MMIRKMWGDMKNFSIEYHKYEADIPANWLIYFEV